MSNQKVVQTETESDDENNPIHHPYAFHVSGPRKVSAPNWRDLINSSWKDGNYKRTVIACFIQAVYLLELDRQENRSEETALAPKWFIPFKYKLSRTLIDERDGSIYGAVLEWDRSAALSDFIVIRPSHAPRAVLALRGTLLKGPTLRRDIQDDLRFLAWESLKGSVRFKGALEALRSISDAYGSHNVAVAGHSLGAGFALQIGKSLAKQGLFVETHLFNPPSVSLAMSLKNMGEKAVVVWEKVKSMVTSSNNGATSNEDSNNQVVFNKWVPHLYVNNSDYICCYYTDPAGGKDGGDGGGGEKENVRPPSAANGHLAAKLFVLSKGKQKFLEAHGLEQWWSDDLELELALQSSKLISKQLKSLYSLPPSSTTSRR
ncbi:putative alpha/Beta hydrolase [Helianthus annuus]|uniref:Alpha/Beta hydrolase n=1 Tax=Helianthus annuus TaxID=4232 RepID=A0A251SA88_HELAN|nr:GDSL esterase/lipase At4g10955 [Helianthus annuus]KAF5765534.1 putative alpha/Beta hydrolase [Helianthus annuus]KAJ0456802.1 putative alpha/Beta hydrolase [Helianthus annuus]KAJ0473946.1 putative alpha/Beta hydrolase [Helianthus annuus]KAJ0649519.1 putative alpha/Beta hydrolase [Helianthus annuus]KAJ0653314.1 putative alpha/Beta hydrolase [Helianthus annuus]